eukprot:TRINITY_DN35125_c0_g1_i1.p1 TRINITY_DN35125_c0_g1~~TRINITY_DN35125_c0_g1_i1.p1  ORF type:complete len:212 (+),score=33.02 TRINITY_DN35125_c0_g1_i1:87-722(+)
MDGPVRLPDDHTSRELYDSLADCFSIIVTIERLEKAYVRGTVGDKDYETACCGLIAKYQALLPSIPADVRAVDAFCSKYRVNAPLSTHRLRQGVPATTEFAHSRATGSSSEGEVTRLTFQIGGCFVTLLDALRCGGMFTTTDQLHPLMADLLQALGRLPSGLRLPPAEIQKLSRWLAVLNNMRAEQTPDDAQVRQMTFEIESAHNAFQRLL